MWSGEAEETEIKIFQSLSFIMRPFGKLAGTGLFEPSSNTEMKSRDQDKSDRKGQESFDKLIRQTMGKDSLLSFSRSGENSVHLINLLNALDQHSGNKLSKSSTVELGMDPTDCVQENIGGGPFLTELSGVKESIHNNVNETGSVGKGLQNSTEQMPSLKFPEAVVAFAQAAAKVNGEPEKYLPGWPLLSKVQMIKCEKCSRDFCSHLNHRRHIRVHRRLLNFEKEDLLKKRADLAEFWDKLSVDDAKQIVSLKNTTLEEIPGSSIVKSMSAFIRKPALPSLPQLYVKAGTALLDVVQTKPSKFPLPAAELFTILDDASEKTFLCAGTASSVQKFVFGAETRKLILEFRNLVASMGFLVELKLVNAWLVDKDAEALRCQKLLVEEEEAAERKRAELLERKRLKKLRQKELKEKGQAVNVESVDSGVSSTDFGDEGSLTAAESSPSSSFFEHDLNNQEQSGHIGSTDNDLESRASQSSSAGVPVHFELDGDNHQEVQHKTYVDRKFVRGWRERKSFNETDLIVSDNHSHSLERKNQQSTLKRTRKSYNGPTARQVSPGGVTIPNSVSGQRFCYNDKSMVRRPSSSGNSYRIWTRKTQQTSKANSEKVITLDGIPKDIADATYNAKSVDHVQSSPDARHNGPTCQVTLNVEQKGLGIPTVESSGKSDLHDDARVLGACDESGTGYLADQISSDELLIGSMSVCINNFPNGVSKPRRLKHVIVNSEHKHWDEFDYSTDGKMCNSSSSSFGSSKEWPLDLNNGALPLRSSGNACAKAFTSHPSSIGDSESPQHPDGEPGLEKPTRQSGASKAGIKFWRPVNQVVDCSHVEGFGTDGTMNSNNCGHGEVEFNVQCRVAIDTVADCPLKDGTNTFENLSHPGPSLKGGVSYTDALSHKVSGSYCSGKGEIVDRILINESGIRVLDCSKEAHDRGSHEQIEVVETIDQRESKFGSTFDAAAALLSQRWENATACSQGEVVYSNSDAAHAGETHYSGVSFVSPEPGRYVTGTILETDSNLQSRDVGGSSIETDQGRQKPFDGGIGTVPSGQVTRTKSLEMGVGAASRRMSGLKPEKGHLRYMPRRQKSEEKNVAV